MKKFKILFVVVLFTAFMGSCTMTEWDDIVSLNITPTLIKKTPKLYPGGNAECSNIGISGLLKTTGRNNYIAATDGFEHGWPKGLIVNVTADKTVAFQIDGAIDLGDGKCYKVGAVIVKGGDASNVYDYTEIGGANMDKGLVSPINSSGSPAGLSNLTFCFIECAQEPVTIAVKTFFWTNYTDSLSWNGYMNAYSTGEYLFRTPTAGWCYSLGVIHFPSTTEFNLYSTLGSIVGSGNVSDVWTNGIHSLQVTVNLNLDNGMMDKTYLYAGNLAALTGNIGTEGCPDHESWRSVLKNSKTHTFIIPFSELH